MKTKTFDCVQMKREGAAEIMRRLEGMTRAQRRAYWNRRTEELIARYRKQRPPKAEWVK